MDVYAQLYLNASLVFPESTELSKAFAKQGLKIPIRNDGKSSYLSQQPF